MHMRTHTHSLPISLTHIRTHTHSHAHTHFPQLCDFGSARSGHSEHGPGTEPSKSLALDLEMAEATGNGARWVRRAVLQPR